MSDETKKTYKGNPRNLGPDLSPAADVMSKEEKLGLEVRLAKAESELEEVHSIRGTFKRNPQVLDAVNKIFIEEWNEETVQLQESCDDIKEFKFSQGKISVLKKILFLEESLEEDIELLEKEISHLTESLALPDVKES